MHTRAKIKEAVKNRLLSISELDNRVYTSRTRELSTVPAGVIYIKQENAERIDNQTLRRNTELSIEVHTQGQTAESDLDSLALLIEDAMTGDETLGDIVHDVQYAGMDQGFVSEEGATTAMAIQIRYTITYFTEETNNTISEDFGGSNYNGDLIKGTT